MLLGVETFETGGGSYKPARGWTEEVDARAQGADLQILLAFIIHEDFDCNHRYTATTSLTVGGLAGQSVNITFQEASLLRRSARPFCMASRRFRHEAS